MMRKITIFVVLLLVCSCQMSEFEDFVGADAEFYAKIEDTRLTKTLLDDNNNILWSAEDQLTIFRQSTVGVRYQVRSEYVGKNQGGFSRVPGESNDDFYAGTALGHNVAYYPYTEGLDCSNADSDAKVGSYRITGVLLPHTQTYAQGSFGNGSFPMIAVSENNVLTFKNICGGIKLQLKGSMKVASITLEGNSGEILAGEALVTAYVNGEVPVVEMNDGGYPSVTLDCGDGVQLDEVDATSFIIALPPVIFTEGFTVKVTDVEGNTGTVSTQASNSVLRSSLLTMPAINVSDAEFGDFDVSLKEFAPGRILLNTAVTEERECAYIVSEEPLDVSPELLIMAGTRDVLDTDGEHEIFTELKENTKYYVYLVSWLDNSGFSEVIEIVFETQTFVYNELCTLTALMYDGFKMHINVPESVENSPHGQLGGRAIRYTHGDLMTYNFARLSDYWNLLWNAGKYTTEDITLDYSADLNYGQCDSDVNEDGLVNEEDCDYLWNPIAPGEPVVYLAGEFEWMTEDQNGYNGFEYPVEWEPGYYLPCMNSEYLWTGTFQKKQFDTKKPSVLDAEVKMDIVKLGPVDATIALTPDPAVSFYCTVILDDFTYDWMLELLDGKEEYLQWATSSYFASYNFGMRVFSGPVEATLSDFFYDVPANTNYHVLVTGMADEKGTKQCFNHYQFRTPQKTKASGPTIVVEPLEDESGAYVSKFRIKCTSPDNPVVRCYYGSNYLKEWIYAINAGGTYLQYGQSTQFYSHELAQINSEDGLVISLPSIDGETTRLVVVGYNDENTPNDLNYEDITKCPAVADLTAPYYTAPLSRSYYDLADVLAGDWTMTAMVAGDGGIGVPQSAAVSLLQAYDDYPSETPQEVYDVYGRLTKMTPMEIDEMWEEFKNQAKVFNRSRLELQNKLALVGWIDGGAYGSYQTMTPYDLLVSETISTVDVKSMFSDFGPKMFIEISDDANGKAKLTITADMMCGLPVSYWTGVPFYLAGRSNQNGGNTVFYYSDINGFYGAPLVFDVDYSDDFSTLTIKAIDNYGVKFYPNVIGQDSQSGRYLLDYPIVSDVVLTKGVTKSAAGTYPPQRNVAVTPVNDELNISYKQHTRFEKPVERKAVEMEVMTLEKVQKNLEKYIQR